MLNACRHHGKEDDHGAGRSRAHVRSAQRLSASRQGGQAANRLHGSPLACSTPVGITARRTPRVRIRLLERSVLNACRHHGKEDPRAACDAARPRSAQRLSASRQGGPGRCRMPATPPRVLNACRHHGKEDNSDPHTRTPGTDVLNACRHHGKEDEQWTSARRWHSACSTPVGITARRTKVRSRAG